MEDHPSSSSTQQHQPLFFLPLAPPSPFPPPSAASSTSPSSSSSCIPSSAPSVSTFHLPSCAWIEDPSRVLRLMMGTIVTCNEAKVLVKELDNWPLPPDWERCLDLKSGQVFIKKPDFTSSSSTQFSLPAVTSTASRKIMTVQDNAFASSALQEHDGDGGLHLDLDLRLTSNQSASDGNSRTRAEKNLTHSEQAAIWRKQAKLQDWESWQMGSCGERRRNVVVVKGGSSSSRSRCEEEEEGASSLPSMATAVCPNCLMYVLLRKNSPRCPKCSSYIPLSTNIDNKRPRLDSVPCPAVVHPFTSPS